MAECVNCGYCCTKTACFYGQHRYHCKPGFPCPGLTSEKLCRVYLEADEELRAEMEGIMGVGIGAGCCSPYNTAAQEKRKVKENPKKIPLGQCYSFAAKKAIDWFAADREGEFKLIQGRCTDKWNGESYLHAWVEIGDRVFDWQTSFTQPNGVPRDVFYDHYQPEPYREYTAEAAVSVCLKAGHWGPWDDVLGEPKENPKRKKLKPKQKRRLKKRQRSRWPVIQAATATDDVETTQYAIDLTPLAERLEPKFQATVPLPSGVKVRILGHGLDGTLPPAVQTAADYAGGALELISSYLLPAINTVYVEIVPVRVQTQHGEMGGLHGGGKITIFAKGLKDPTETVQHEAAHMLWESVLTEQQKLAWREIVGRFDTGGLPLEETFAVAFTETVADSEEGVIPKAVRRQLKQLLRTKGNLYTNPPLRVRDLTSLVSLCDARFEVSVIPWYDLSVGNGLHFHALPFEPYDVEIVLRAKTLPQGITLPRQYDAGTFTAHYVCTDRISWAGRSDAPLYRATSGLAPNFQRKGFGILAYLGLMEVLALFGGWLGAESRFGGTTSDDAQRVWLYLQNLDGVFHRQVDNCGDYDPYSENYLLDAPTHVWQYVGPRVLGGLVPAKIKRHSAVRAEGIATGRKTFVEMNNVVRDWIKRGDR